MKEAQATPPTFALREMVRLKIPSLHGPMTVAGFITSFLRDGRIEVKTQAHGYFLKFPSELEKTGKTL